MNVGQERQAIAWWLGLCRTARRQPAFARILRPPAPPANPPNSTANRLRIADCRGIGASAYCTYEIVSTKRTRDQLASDRRILCDWLRALHALPRSRAVAGWPCLSGRVEHVALRHAADHDWPFHLLGLRLWFALIVAALNLLRPSLMLFGAALAAACCGIVLYNIALSALAAGLLVLSFARRAPEPD